MRRTRISSQLQRLVRGGSGESGWGSSPNQPDQRVGGGQDGAQDREAAARQGLDRGAGLAVLHLDGQLPGGRPVRGAACLGGRALGQQELSALSCRAGCLLPGALVT